MKLLPPIQDSRETKETPELESPASGARGVVLSLCSALTHAPILGEESCPSPKFPRYVSPESRIVRLGLPHDIGVADQNGQRPVMLPSKVRVLARAKGDRNPLGPPPSLAQNLTFEICGLAAAA